MQIFSGKMSRQVIIYVSVILITVVNFMMWSNSNYGSGRLLQLYNGMSTWNWNYSKMEMDLEEIRIKLDSELEMLSVMKQQMGKGEGGSFDSLFQKMKTFSMTQVPTRKQVLKQISKAAEFYLLYGSLAPEVFCPVKVRVGSVGDGGKWVCNPWNVPNETVLFSLGLNNWIGFEEEWQRITHNRNILYGFDTAEQNSQTRLTYSKIRGTSKKATISVSSNPSKDMYTIEDLAKLVNVSSVEILKIDIEGAELTCLVPFLEKYQVCQIYLEVHGGAPEHAKLLSEIAHLNYRLFSYEVNGFDLKACEYSFIHEQCVDKYEAMRIANFLDFKN